MANQQKRTIAEILADGATLDAAMRQGVREALLRHKKLGESIAVWKDGKVAIVPPEEIEVSPEEDVPGRDPQSREPSAA